MPTEGYTPASASRSEWRKDRCWRHLSIWRVMLLVPERARTACFGEWLTSSARIEGATRQATTFRYNTSTTSAKWIEPAHVATYVKFAARSWLWRNEHELQVP